MKKLFWIILILIVAAAAVFVYRWKLTPPTPATIPHEHMNHEKHEHKNHGEEKALYQCPMHPTYTSDKPGDCAICGMKLVPTKKKTEREMQMKPGEVMISPEKQQLIGVRTQTVSRRNLQKTIRTVGRIEYDETKIAYVNTKFEGWIEKLFVDYTGKGVRKGEPLFSVYSPELVSTQQEYLLALNNLKKLEEAGNEELVKNAQELVKSAKQRLLFWDISSEQVKNLDEKGEITKTLTIRSPLSGFVIEKMALQGMHVMPGENLYKIADLRRIWILADIYEYEFPFVKLGQQAKISLSYLPYKTFIGKVNYIFPYLEKETRTAKVRIEVNNLDFALKPEMFANVEIKVDFGTKIALPVEAVLDSGTRQIVFIDKGEGHFEPREIKLGRKTDDDYEVLAGVNEGDKVVTSANFLIDSESSIKAAMGAMEHQH